MEIGQEKEVSLLGVIIISKIDADLGNQVKENFCLFSRKNSTRF